MELNFVVIASVMGAGFLFMLIFNAVKMGKVAKKEKPQVKQKLFLYGFGTVFAFGLAVFGYMQGF